MSDEVSPLDRLQEAVQEFVNTSVDRPTLVDNAIVIWEEVSYDDDGVTMRRMRYAVPTDNFTMSGTLGLIEAASEYVRRDILGFDRVVDDESDD